MASTDIDRRGVVSRRGLLAGVIAAAAFLLGRSSVGWNSTADPTQTALTDFERALEPFLESLLPEGSLPGYRTSGLLQELVGRFGPGTGRHRFAVELLTRLDSVATRMHRRPFSALELQDRTNVLAELEEEDLPGFILIRSDAHDLHYSHSAVWTALAFHGPPQPTGYEDFDRAPRR